MCCSRKYPYLPPHKEIFLRLPTHLETPIKLHTQYFGPTESPKPPMKFQSLLWEENGYFLELHNIY